MIQEDFDRIAIGIQNSLVTYASLMPNDKSMLTRAIDANKVVCNVARCVATELGKWNTNMDLTAFATECAMEISGDAVWRVPPNGVYVSTYPG